MLKGDTCNCVSDVTDCLAPCKMISNGEATVCYNRRGPCNVRQAHTEMAIEGFACVRENVPPAPCTNSTPKKRGDGAPTVLHIIIYTENAGCPVAPGFAQSFLKNTGCPKLPSARCFA